MSVILQCRSLKQFSIDIRLILVFYILISPRHSRGFLRSQNSMIFLTILVVVSTFLIKKLILFSDNLKPVSGLPKLKVLALKQLLQLLLRSAKKLNSKMAVISQPGWDLYQGSTPVVTDRC